MLFVLSLAWPSGASAEDYVATPGNYSIRQDAEGVLRFEMPVYDQESSDAWINSGEIFFEGDGIPRQRFIKWSSNGVDIPSGDKSCSTNIIVNVKGRVTLVRSENSSYPDSDVDLAEGSNNYNVWRNGQTEHLPMILTWKVPLDMRGKSVKFTYIVTVKGNSKYKNVTTISIPAKTIDIMAPPTVMNPIVTQAMILEEKEYLGKIVVPWMLPVDSSQVKKVTAKYIRPNGNSDSFSLEINSSGFAKLQPETPYRQFRIVADYIDSEGNYMNDVSSDAEDIAMIHAPIDFSARALNDIKASVQLTWKINELQYEDLMEGDVFQIQRSLTGRDEDFIDIGFEMLDLSKADYTYVDSTIIEALRPEHIDQATGGVNVMYRIRRGVTSVWGWDSSDNPTVKKAYTSKMKPLRLTQVTNADAYWLNQDEHKIHIRWQFDKDNTHNFVWDDRAEIDLCVYMYNRKEQLVDSLIYTLTQSEIQAKDKHITLPRSCVNYKFEFKTRQGQSPIPYYFATFISTPEDWEAAAKKVLNKEKNLKLVLKSDIVLPERFTPLGEDDYNRFEGEIEGNGHTITVDSENPLILYGNHCTISNLIVAGTNKGRHSAGLAQALYNTTIDNVIMKVNFTCQYPNKGFNDDLVSAFCNNTINVTFNNCLFSGTIPDMYNWGGFDGAAEDTKFNNCVNAPEKSEGRFQCYDFYTPYDNKHTYSPTLTNCFYTTTSNLEHQGELLPETIDEQLAALGAGWMKTEAWPSICPTMTNLAQDYVVTDVYNTDNLNFYFESNGKVTKTLEATTRQSSVYLTWGTDGGVIDYFQVSRRVKGTSKWDIIEESVTEMAYEDTKVSPLLEYEYMVESAVNCEGTHYEASNVVTGFCEHTGMIEGYVRFADGTAIPDLKVIVSLGELAVDSVKTDNRGYYMFKGLSYNGKNSVNYSVTVVSDPSSQGAITLERSPYNADFDSETNYAMLPDFVVVSGVSFSGYVYYEGTQIPVRGAGFTVNGKQVLTPSGDNLVTDFEGKFSFFVNPNAPMTIRPVMAGHLFSETQVFKHVFTDKVDEYYFYDDTKVKLIGRMVGGNVQGDLPLDNSLSRNNLGENLTMVLSLEGDNSSKLVYDSRRSSVTERDTVFTIKSHDGKEYGTRMRTTQKLVEVRPDPTTGEYVAYLPPVKWKVQHLSCSGYPTLFPEGKISDVIDLTEALFPKNDTISGNWLTLNGKSYVHEAIVSYNAIYNCIYHTPTQLTYKQLGFDTFDYYGDKSYQARNLAGDNVTVPLVYQVPTQPYLPADSTIVMKTEYTFGHPVFSIEKKYPFRLSAVEKYYWNNNQKSDTVDIVRLNGGRVTIHNGMVSTTHSEVVDLDSVGQAIVKLDADKIPYLLTGKDALRTVNMTLERDGTLYEAEPLQAYILNIYAMKSGTDILSINQPVLVDILRDPPGSGSSATLSKGSTLKYSYSMDMSWQTGLELSIKKGTALASFYGAVAAPMGAGVVTGVNSGAETSFETSLALMFSGSGKRAFEYTMTASEDISTNDSGDVVGADGDVYIGVEQNIVVKPAYTIRAIPHSHFLQMGGQLEAKRAIEIAQGTDDTGALYHLVRDESLAYGPQIKSTFHHSQQYIISTLIPGLINQCKSLMFTGTLAEAKAQAEKTGKPVYLALVSPDDEKHFGVMNMKNDMYYRYTDRMPEEPGMNYRIILPSKAKDSDINDEVQQYCASLKSWIGMIAQNEGEKLSANELVRNFTVDGGVGGVSYEEEFSSDYSCMNSMVWPVSGITDSYFDNTAGNAALTIVQVVGPTVAKFLGSILSTSTGGINTGTEFGGKVEFVGALFEFGLTPALAYDVKPEWETSKSYSRKESFSIGMELKSHLNFDVYRVKTKITDNMASDAMDVFTSENFYEQVNYNEEYLKRHLDLNDAQYARGFVYRTRGGATCRPWEGERRTIFYQAGHVLDEATKMIENPGIKLDKQTISGVPLGQPARFKIYLTNETQQPENTYDYYHLYQEEASNPKGAKLMVDGMPLSGTGRVVKVLAGEVTEKTLEVFASDDFDYEGIIIGLCSVDGEKFADSEASFDVHYLRAAGEVNISSPGDKWILNTDAQYDEKFGYYLPIIIDGFDKYQKNFDHIEFQYKESARGDEFWTNQCSYYASDSLFALANGVKEMIPENGHITAQFFGEGVIMEKAYDLRAVLFCRNGNGFLTSTSKVLSGVKDTRRPTLFGTPKPTDGVIDIGDDIIFDFSEDIEYNYLNRFNFEVRGEVNNKNISEDVSVLFDKKSSLETEARRNFNAKDITVEVMIKPEKVNQDMPIFSHGTNGKKLQLWFTKEQRLRVVIDDNSFTSTRELTTETFTPVALRLKHLTDTYDGPCKVDLFNGGDQIGDFKIDHPYTGTGTIIFGRTNESDRLSSTFFKGRMMEARLWYRALTADELANQYGNKRLTGYELGLAGYYPMNDGNGDYATDKAQGAHAKLIEASWAVPHGMSLHIDWDDHGIPLDPHVLDRANYQDYTLTFWFKTDPDGRGTLIANGTGEAIDEGAESQFYIGFDSEKLNFKSNGMTVNVPGDYSDNQWHHYAMTVNRSLNLGQIFIDNKTRATFPVDSLGGISGGHPMLGTAKFSRTDENGVVVADSRNYFRGNIDEICFFEQALPSSLIKTYSTNTPHGDETGLIFYLSFSRQELQSNNQMETVPYPYSSKIHKDQNGNIIYEVDPVTRQSTGLPQRDYPFDLKLISPEELISHIDRNIAAPVKPYEELTNISYSYVGKGNQIYFNINEDDERINRRNIYVTVKDIPDKNGNTMASPATAYYFVDSNPLRWVEDNIRDEVFSGSGSSIWIEIANNSAVRHTYHIENCPRWLKFEKETDVIGPRQTEELVATINPNLNVGTYDEIIYLVDEDGLSDPLGISITIIGEEPKWAVESSLMQYTMNIIGQVKINDELDVDERDIIGVFDDKNNCHGVANIGNGEDQHLFYLTVYDDKLSGRELYFKLWRYDTGKELLLKPSETITFGSSELIGSVGAPVIFSGGSQYAQTIELSEGWNWVSFNVYGEQFFDINRLLASFPWNDNDIITDNNTDVTFVYNNGGWNASDDVKKFKLTPQSSYAIKVAVPLNLIIGGTIIRQEDDRTITVWDGWNGIGYTPMMNLTVTTALQDYEQYAEDGDIIKSHDEFAVFTRPNNKDKGVWKGSLQYMKPGEGYMLYHKRQEVNSFLYPFYEPGSTFLDEITKAPARPAAAGKAMTMSMSAITNGVELMPGDRLLAFADGELRGAVEAAADSIFYLSIEGDVQQPLWFAIEREGDVIASTNEILTFQANSIVGMPDNPTKIDFTLRDIPKFGWYTLEGYKLNKRPTKKGVYIYNGKKIVIE